MGFGHYEDWFCEMSLASVFCSGRPGLTERRWLDFLCMSFILSFVRSNRNSKSGASVWHSALLGGYLESASDAFILRSACPVFTANRRACAAIVVVRRNQRRRLHPWTLGAAYWSLCGGGSELIAVLLDARWMNVRGKHGGLLGLKADFGSCR